MLNPWLYELNSKNFQEVWYIYDILAKVSVGFETLTMYELQSVFDILSPVFDSQISSMHC